MELLHLFSPYVFMACARTTLIHMYVCIMYVIIRDILVVPAIKTLA